MAAVRQKGWWYPWIYVGIFLIVVVVNGIMIKIAFTISTAGTVSSTPYEDGLRYNEVLEQARAQEALGWNVESNIYMLETPEKGPQHLRLDLQLRDKERNPITDAKVSVLFFRVIGQNMDTPLTLTYGQNSYEGDIVLPAPGQLDVQITITRGSDTYRRDIRICTPKDLCAIHEAVRKQAPSTKGTPLSNGSL